MRRKYQRLREAAYQQGRTEFAELARDPKFRDFVCLYIAEGSKRNRNVVAICNSDPAVVILGAYWIRRFTSNVVTYSIQYHADQSLDELRSFWSARLGIAAAEVRFQRKSNSGRLNGRGWRSAHGVLTVRVGDTTLRARLQGWIDCLQGQWLDSLRDGA